MKYTIIILWITILSTGVFAQHDHSKIDQLKTTYQSTIMKNDKVSYTPYISSIMDNYLALKDAFVEDNSTNAAKYGKMLLDEFVKFDYSAKSISIKNKLSEIIEDACEQSEHIWKNSGKLDHQREHFENLSIDLKDLILITGLNDNIYQMFCPMYNNNRGAMWLSSTREVKNPYFGSEMLSCGSVQREFSVRWN